MPSVALRTPSPRHLPPDPTPSRISTVERRNSRPRKLERQSPMDSVDSDDGDVMNHEDGEDEDNQGYVGGGANYIPQAEMDPEEEEDVLNNLNFEDIQEDKTQFKAGAIRRIVVENFLTYKRMEVNMGPGLNMIIGPNGTGKSSIVCAICLGLGWAPSVLGRSKELGDFVKHGESSGSIEIELQKRENDNRNPVIKRRLIKENNGSSWWINGAVSTNVKVVKLAKSYNIQIDNLCTFLPQDKVAEFAKITPPERLKATLRAAAPPEMLEMHENLCALGKRSAEVITKLDNESKHLKNLETRQAMDEVMVQRMRDREKHKERIELLRKAQPVVTYYIARKEAHKAKAACTEELKFLKQLQEEAQPELEKPEEKKNYLEQVRKVAQLRENAVRQTQRKLNDLKDDVTKIEGEIKQTGAKIDAEWHQFSARNDQIKKIKDNIRKLEGKITAGPPNTDMTDLNEQLSTLRAKEHDIGSAIVEIQSKEINIKDNRDQLERRIQGAQLELERMNSLEGQREQAFMRRNPNGHKLWQYYQKNRDKFKGKVYPPPILSCSIKDPRAMDAVESLIGRVAMTFTSENIDDYNLLTRLVAGGRSEFRGVNLRDYSITKAPTLQQQAPPRIPREQLGLIGFDGYCIDFIEAPDAVMNMLCWEANINSIPIALKPLKPQQKHNADHAGFQTYVDGSSTVQHFHRYGVTSTRTMGIKPASIFKMGGVDTQRKSELERSINEWTYEADEFKNQLREYEQRLKDYSNTKRHIHNERGIIDNEKKKIRDQEVEFKKFLGRLDAFKNDLKEKKNAQKSFDDIITGLNSKVQELACRKAKKALEYASLVTQLVDEHNRFVQMNIRVLEAESDLKLLEDNVRHIQRKLDNQRRVVERLNEEAQALRAKGKKLQSEVQRIIKDCTEEETNTLRQLCDGKDSMEDLESFEREIAEIDTQLKLLQGGQEGVLERYEKRALDIEKGRKRITKMVEEQEQTQTAIEEVRSEWEPRLERLVDRISRAFTFSFSKIDSGGEVRIHRAKEGFDKWAIDILVKFREEENMQILDSHRQSGGERAVTTVFYLMALQSLAQSPFRVVDEINQGMDPRNERIVHHRMVNVACQKNTSQYFLITPKLLSDLVYHPRMKVHCVYSGDHLEKNMVMDVKKCIQAGIRMKKQRTVAAH